MITSSHPLSTEATIHYHADDIRKDRTGTHAKIVITLDSSLLAWSTFNIERDEDRVRLANSAWNSLGAVDAEVWGKPDMKRALDVFCHGLWEDSIGQIDVGMMGGSRRVEGPSYPLRPFLIRGGGSLIYAPPGRGKSFSAILMAVSMDAGASALFDCPHPVRTLYINIERSGESMADRLARVNNCLGLDEARPLAFINARGKSLNDIIDAARAYIQRERIEVVLLDSISRAGFGDLKEDQPVNKLMDAMNGLVETWGALAHTPRADESHIFGSVHFDAGADIAVKMLTQPSDDGWAIGIGLSVTKANDGKVGGDPFTYALEFDETGLRNIRPVKKGEFYSLTTGKPRSPEQLIREFLVSYGMASSGEINENTGVSAPEISRILGAVNWAIRDRRGKQVFWGVAI